MTDPVISIVQDLRRMGQTTLDTAWQAIRLVDWLRAPEPCGRIPPTDSKTLNHLLAQAVAGIVQRNALTKENAILNELISRCGVEEMTEMRFTKKPPAEGQSWFLIVDRWRGLYVYHYSPASAATAKAKFHIKAAIIPHADSRGWRVAFDSDGNQLSRHCEDELELRTVAQYLIDHPEEWYDRTVEGGPLTPLGKSVSRGPGA